MKDHEGPLAAVNIEGIQSLAVRMLIPGQG